jgi:hypothetical protein
VPDSSKIRTRLKDVDIETKFAEFVEAVASAKAGSYNKNIEVHLLRGISVTLCHGQNQTFTDVAIRDFFFMEI